MNVVFTPTAWQQYTDWQKEEKKIVKRINELIFGLTRVCAIGIISSTPMSS